MRRRSLRDVRDVALLHPYQLPLVVSLVVIAVVFTIWPDALDHSPISFETRGIIHHVWHYTLLTGSLVTLYAMLWAHPARRIQAEVIGLLALGATVALNFIALAADTFDGTPAEGSGLGLGLRAALIIGFGLRLYTLVWQPTVQVSIEPRRES